MIRELAVLSICALLLAGTTGDSLAKSKDIEKGFLLKSIKLDKKDINYTVYVPAVYNPKTAIPMIVFLNGYGQCGKDGFNQVSLGLGPAIMANVNAWPFIVLFPQKQEYDAGWEDEDSMVMAIMDKTLKDYKIDKSRVYMTGISQGGHGTFMLGGMHPELFAAIAPACGWGATLGPTWAEDDEKLAKKLVGMPIWALHGDADTVIPTQASITMSDLIKKAGGECKLTLLSGMGHMIQDKVYREMNLGQWFLEHHK